MYIHQAKMDGHSLIDAMEAKHTWRLKIASRIQVSVLFDRSMCDESSRNTPDRGVICHRPDEGLDNQPLPNKERRRIALGRSIIDILNDKRADRNCGQEADALHPFTHGWNKLRGKLIGDQVQSKRVDRTLGNAR